MKVVDAGSVSRASSILNVAQPALSQQMAALEAHFGHKLLIRSNTGISPTEAGLILYRHDQLMLRQLDQAQADMSLADGSIAGRMSIGLATYSTTSALSIPFLKTMRRLHPDIVVHVNDSFGHVLSELVMTGKMDMALIYGEGPIKGVTLQPLVREEMFLVSPTDVAFDGSDDAPLPLAALDGVALLLPSRGHFLRQLIEASLARARVTPRVVAEIESVSALAAAVMEGLGSTILPASVVSGPAGFAGVALRRLVRPVIEATVSLCVSDHLPLSEPAIAARAVLLDTVGAAVRIETHGLTTV